MDLIRQLRANGGKTVKPVGSNVPPNRTMARLVEGPGAIQQARNFARATAQHILAGLPVRSDERVAELFAICSSNRCGLFHPIDEGHGKCLHPSCGCNMRDVGVTGLNKLKYAEQACPVGMFPADIDKKQEGESSENN
jgi:hypothetical protein